MGGLIFVGIPLIASSKVDDISSVTFNNSTDLIGFWEVSEKTKFFILYIIYGVASVN